MAPDQDLAARLRELARQSLEPRIENLANEIREIQLQVSQALARAAERLQELRELDLTGSADVLSSVIEEAAQHRAEDLHLLIGHAAAVQRLETQEEILNSLLDGAFRDKQKVALFTVRGNRIHGWASRGYDEGAAAGIASYESSTENPLFRQALSSESGVTIDDLSEAPGLVELLLGGTPGRLHFFSMKTMGRPVGVLVTVPSGSPSENLDAVRLLVNISAMRIENLALCILKEFEIAPKSRVEPVPPARQPRETEAEMPPAGMSGAEKPAAIIATVQTEGGELVEAGTVPEQVVPDLGAAEPLLPTAEPAALPQPQEYIAAEKPPEVGAPEMPESPTATQDAAAQLEYLSPPPKPAPTEEPPRFAEEERLHSEAKRFARLLISEIKLYNEQRVVEGRENRDIYVRLKRDIDRSREMYRKRVSPQVSRKVDYFHDEIVRILGENDASTLGSDYPGPLIES